MKKNKKIKSIKLKIVNNTIGEDAWYSNKIGRSFYFFDKPFTDYHGIKSLYKATLPLNHYAYLEDVNYNNHIRKQKLKKLNKINDKI